jgi:hypothetical protein
MKIVTAICAVFFALSFMPQTWDLPAPHENLWIVIRLKGDIGGTVGPLPYDIDECQRRASELTENADQHVVTPQGYSVKDVSITCEFHEQRPGYTGRWTPNN